MPAVSFRFGLVSLELHGVRYHSVFAITLRFFFYRAKMCSIPWRIFLVLYIPMSQIAGFEPNVLNFLAHISQFINE